MVKILNTFSIISLTSAVAVFAFCVIEWTRDKPGIDPDEGHSIVEKFKQRKDGNQKGFQQPISPLVKQAEAFASYLNPPAPLKSVHTQMAAPAVNRGGTTARYPKTTPKFTLLATSCYRAEPEESLALVSEPGQKPCWVRTGKHIGHFILTKIERGKIVYQDGDQKREMAMNIKIPAHTEEDPQVTLTSDETKLTRSGPSVPDNTQKVRSRESTNTPGSPRKAIHVMASDQKMTDG